MTSPVAPDFATASPLVHQHQHQQDQHQQHHHQRPDLGGGHHALVGDHVQPQPQPALHHLEAIQGIPLPTSPEDPASLLLSGYPHQTQSPPLLRYPSQPQPYPHDVGEVTTASTTSGTATAAAEDMTTVTSTASEVNNAASNENEPPTSEEQESSTSTNEGSSGKDSKKGANNSNNNNNNHGKF